MGDELQEYVPIGLLVLRKSKPSGGLTSMNAMQNLAQVILPAADLRKLLPQAKAAMNKPAPAAE